MSWLFSRVLVEEYLGANCLDGEPSVQSSGKPTPLAFCAPDRMKAYSRLSRYGVTFAPLTADLGEELLTSFRGDFPVQTYPLQEKARDLMETSPQCGTKWRGWLAKYDPDSSLWRIPQCSLLEEESESLQTLPRWGMTQNGWLWELPMLAHHTNATAFGYSLPTPTTNPDAPNKNANTKGPKSLGEVANGQWNHLFPTPTASQMPCEGTVRIMRKAWQSGEFTLEEASAVAGRDVRKAQGKVPMMPTPNAWDGKRGPMSKELMETGKHQISLVTYVKHNPEKFPTPTATDHKNQPTSASWKAKGGVNYKLSNPEIQQKWGTPKAQDSRHALTDRGKGNLGEQVSGLHNGGKLNPLWVEWLMGYPIGWTDLSDAVMDKSHSVQQPLGES